MMEKITRLNGINFSTMNTVTLAYNIGTLTEAELKHIPEHYLHRVEAWQKAQNENTQYWSGPLHC